MQKVKNSWKARGRRHATSRGANENPSVSQFEILKPVIQFAVLFSQPCAPTANSIVLTHLNYNELSSAVHLTRFGLPYSSRRRVHTCSKSSYDSSDHHACYSPTASLNDRTNAYDGRAE